MSFSCAYLAFDLGASSGRVVLGQFDGHEMQMRVMHRFPTLLVEEGERLYWDIEALWQSMLEGLRRVSDVRSLSVDSWGVDYVPLDAAMQPLRRAHAYRDPRTHRVAHRVEKDTIYGITGIQPLVINTLYQVLADQEMTPDIFARTRCRLLIADYFNYLFSSHAVAEVSLASTTQLYDPVAQVWATGAMEQLGISSQTWPAVVLSGTRLGPVTMRPSVQTIAGCSHDTACAVAAVPAQEDTSWAYLSSGTWSLLGVELSAPVLTEVARKGGFTNEIGIGHTVRFLKNIAGLWVLQECEREWRSRGEIFDYDLLLAEARKAAPAEGFVDLNEMQFSLRGDMSAKLRAYCREKGMEVPSSRGAMVRLILKSLAAMYRKAVQDIEKLLGCQIKVVHVVGGGSRNALLCQWTADACGCPVVAGPAEATALGNLLIQAQTMGDLPSGVTIRDIVRQSCVLCRFEPQ